MLGGKSAAQVQPTAFSVMLQANSYGVVIPVIYGLAKSPMYGIWMNHLRKGQSDKKGKKAEKKRRRVLNRSLRRSKAKPFRSRRTRRSSPRSPWKRPSRASSR